MSESVTTARALIQPRAPTSTCCWHSVTEVGDSTSWNSIIYDTSFITSFSGFGFWVDWCRSTWCDTATVGTTCESGSIRGISMSQACGGTTARCITETMYQKSGDATPKLHKVFCERGNWVARTYYMEEPPARRQVVSSSSSTLPASSSATTTIIPPSSSSTALSASSNTSLPPAQTSLPPQVPASESNGASPAVIAGSVIGGVALLAIIAIALLWRKKKSKRTVVHEAPDVNYDGYTQHPNAYDKYYQTGGYVTELPATSPASELPGHVVVPARQ